MSLSPSPTSSGFVAIVGPANAGKSTLLNKILGQKISIVSRKQQSTRNRVLGIKTKDFYQIVFFDTPGFLKKNSKGELSKYLSYALNTSVSEADSILLVVDAAQAAGSPRFVEKLKESLGDKNISTPSCIALNKVDIIEKEQLLPLIADLQKTFEDTDIEFVPVSAHTGDGVERLLDVLSGKLPEGPLYFPSDMLSDQSEEFLAAEIIRESLFERVHQELPYSSAVRITGWEEGGSKLHINAEILVEKESQKGIVIGKKGATLKAIGTAARAVLEKRFRTPVFLELFVKVEQQWTRSRRGLSRAGYQTLE